MRQEKLLAPWSPSIRSALINRDMRCSTLAEGDCKEMRITLRVFPPTISVPQYLLAFLDPEELER